MKHSEQRSVQAWVHNYAKVIVLKIVSHEVLVTTEKR